MQAFIAGQAGDLQRAYSLFNVALRTDISNLHGNTNEGVHAASLGGTWQAVIFGFGGVSINRDQLLINPASLHQLKLKDFKSYLVERAIARFNRYYSSISVEMQAAINSARESKYRQRDPEGKFLYRWGIRKDNRTTDQCLEIDRRVRERMRQTKKIGVELDWLKALINQVAIEHDSKYNVRDWVPHYRCRSVLKRVVL